MSDEARDGDDPFRSSSNRGPLPSMSAIMERIDDVDPRRRVTATRESQSSSLSRPSSNTPSTTSRTTTTQTTAAAAAASHGRNRRIVRAIRPTTTNKKNNSTIPSSGASSGSAVTAAARSSSSESAFRQQQKRTVLAGGERPSSQQTTTTATPTEFSFAAAAAENRFSFGTTTTTSIRPVVDPEEEQTSTKTTTVATTAESKRPPTTGFDSAAAAAAAMKEEERIQQQRMSPSSLAATTRSPTTRSTSNTRTDTRGMTDGSGFDFGGGGGGATAAAASASAFSATSPPPGTSTSSSSSNNNSEGQKQQVRVEEVEEEDEEDDDDDEDDDDERPAADVNPFQVLQQDSDDDDDDEEEEEEDSDEGTYDDGDGDDVDYEIDANDGIEDSDDESSECNCPVCRQRRRMRNIVGSDDDEDGDGDHDLMGHLLEEMFFETMRESTERQQRWRRSGQRNHHNVEDDEDSDDDDDDDDHTDDAHRCAICFRSPKRRPLVVLPCCGANGSEESSTTRFCKACILQSWEVSDKNASERGCPHHGYNNGDDDDNNRVGECPRCKRLIMCSAVTNTPPPRDGSNNRNSGKKTESIFKLAPFFHMLDYAYPRSGMKQCMFFLAFVNYRYFPVEVLDLPAVTGAEKLRQMSQWGIISADPKSKKGDVYRMNSALQQRAMYYYMTSIAKRPEFVDDGELITDFGGWRRRAMVEICTDVFGGVLKAAKKLKGVMAVRLINETLLQIWVWWRFVPIHSCHEDYWYMIAILNWGLVLMIVGLALVIGTVFGAGWLLLHCAGLWMKASRQRKFQLSSQAALHFAFYVVGITSIRIHINSRFAMQTGRYIGKRIYQSGQDNPKIEGALCDFAKRLFGHMFWFGYLCYRVWREKKANDAGSSGECTAADESQGQTISYLRVFVEVLAVALLRVFKKQMFD